MTRLATVHTPAGNIIELHHEDGVFTSRLYVPEEPLVLTREQAADLYRLVQLLDGVHHRQFPRTEPEG